MKKLKRSSAKARQPRSETATVMRAAGAPKERKFGSHRSVEFPQVKGKTTERVEFYSIADYHCITIDFEDKTSLNLEIEPCFTINAELQQRRKGERDMILEWPPIPSQK